MEAVGVSIISKKGEKRRYLPLEIRVQMYDDVIELRKQGLTQKEIQEVIYEKYGLQLPQSTISTWINRKKHPFGRFNKFDDKPSSELAYIIGAIFGDGCRYLYSKNEQYLLQLAVKDYEFAEAFGKNLAKVLGRKEPYKPFWNEKLKLWEVKGYSILLYKFLDRPFEELKPYIEYSKDTVSAFLRALFDGEGSIYKRVLILYNTNTELLNYASYLLKKYFDANTTGPYLAKKKGKVIHINNVITKTTKDLYYLHIRANSLLNFYNYIGFTVERKQEKLIKAVKQEIFLPPLFST